MEVRKDDERLKNQGDEQKLKLMSNIQKLMNSQSEDNVKVAQQAFDLSGRKRNSFKQEMSSNPDKNQ